MVLHIVGLSLLAVAAAVAGGIGVELVRGDGDVGPLVVSLVLLGVPGVALWRGTVPGDGRGARTAIRAVGWSWLAISVGGAVPYVAADVLAWDLALFESISGFTGTGSTVLSPIEGTGEGLLFYRQLTQWIGGMGVVVLAVAVLPFLGIGGLSLFTTESPGPTSDQLAARVSDTARRLWTIYCALTALSALILLLCGMGPYDAVVHAATAVATGGFSPYNDSISHFDSAAVEFGAAASMFLGATKFPLFWFAWRDRSLAPFLRSSEFRVFVGLVGGAVAAITALNVLGSPGIDGMGVGAAFRSALFNAVSLVSSCGFGTDDFTQWVGASQLILLFLMVTGSMAGSTSGALKLFRVQVVLKHAWREVRRIRHPRAVLPIRLGREPVEEAIVRSVLGYVMLYFVIALAGILALGFLGSDLATAAGSVVTAMGGVGPGLGETGPASNFLVIDPLARGVVMFLMLVGRLEVFPLLFFLMRPFDRGRPLEPRRPSLVQSNSRSGGR